MGTTREALEAALAAEPESVALHSAYADLLIEEGDPRGEFIRLDLLLDDTTLNRNERKILKRRAEEILSMYERKWLGELIMYCEERISEFPEALRIEWHRGWIAEVEVRSMISNLFSLLSNCPMMKCNQVLRLHFRTTVFEPVTDWNSQFDAIESIPFSKLVIHSYSMDGDSIMEAFLQNVGLSRVTDLELDDCAITDYGAELLARAPRIRNLKSLSLDNNYLSPIGITALAEVGFDVGPQLGNPAWDGDTDAV